MSVPIQIKIQTVIVFLKNSFSLLRNLVISYYNNVRTLQIVTYYINPFDFTWYTYSPGKQVILKHHLMEGSKRLNDKTEMPEINDRAGPLTYTGTFDPDLLYFPHIQILGLFSLFLLL